MHIDLPNGDKAIPNAEFADKLGVVVRTSTITIATACRT
jgi:hypothetical protein